MASSKYQVSSVGAGLLHTWHVKFLFSPRVPFIIVISAVTDGRSKNRWYKKNINFVKYGYVLQILQFLEYQALETVINGNVYAFEKNRPSLTLNSNIYVVMVEPAI